jgi:cytochrome c551/c552
MASIIEKGGLMKSQGWMVVAGLAFAVMAAPAAQADVLKDKGCLNCHAMDKKKVGPSFQDIAAKYKGKGAEGQLVEKLKSGKGHMKVKGSDADIEAAVKAALAAQ